ncbi:MAG TPA: hypothetical protein VMH20_02720 [Verrucomicrobiae bacterium]|nr:hypothetical protein [Verrucomicrobiae bacterium]
MRVNAVNPGLIDTQIARDVVSGDEQAYADIAKSVHRGRRDDHRALTVATSGFRAPRSTICSTRWPLAGLSGNVLSTEQFAPAARATVH